MRDAGFLLISLRPSGEHAPLRRLAARHGGRVLAMSPWRIRACDDEDTRTALAEALACPRTLFTSPAAVRAAHALRPLPCESGRKHFGIGEGTRRALQRAGIVQTQAPTRMDSEGLLALPAFTALTAGDEVGLITAPGGRGEIFRQLTARGIRVRRADVYRREPRALAPAGIARLRAALGDTALPVAIALSSGEAFGQWLAQLPDDLAERLRRRATVIAASARLAQLAREHGYPRVNMAASARPRDLLAAIQPSA
ncbi:uroporphyrinogen-III synthase [Lysobacter pythonis]|uniref:Uroporphyrinogen-III synthase n=1 Tax=Solilutibacter pythonis TaxID=2483112 RepID=A0A3M2I4L9_9GAMM|nr:uroporphyrinogen-III synthase [Lysobacter pythonis]RMH93174.1 uroporphyrinogen-III synthase [Lysobacter pythonis]